MRGDLGFHSEILLSVLFFTIKMELCFGVYYLVTLNAFLSKAPHWIFM